MKAIFSVIGMLKMVRDLPMATKQVQRTIQGTKALTSLLRHGDATTRFLVISLGREGFLGAVLNRGVAEAGGAPSRKSQLLEAR